jgi:hypothetical protein
MDVYVDGGRARIPRFLAFVCSVLVLSICASAQTKSENVTVGYVRALARANQFLNCWSMRDQACGLAMASPTLKKAFGDRQLRQYMSGTSSPRHASYEIERGAALPDGRIAFPVRLYEEISLSPDTEKHDVQQLSRIVMVRTKEEWLVDEVPYQKDALKK